MPTSGDAPLTGASPTLVAAAISSPDRTPACSQAVRVAWSTFTPRSSRVLISTASSAGTTTPCPVACTATGSDRAAANRTAAWTSATDRAPTTTAGRCLVAALNSWPATS